MTQSRIGLQRAAQLELSNVKRALIKAHMSSNTEAWKAQLPSINMVTHHLNVIMHSCDEASKGYISNPPMRHTMYNAATELEAIVVKMEEMQLETEQATDDPEKRDRMCVAWTDMILRVGKVELSPPIPVPRSR